ncbi:unnamed protein product [Durusdinium trenchii]|uniref:Non-specific serine/threonine protein kinase n=1 Tax=Durusdinium trenchii TaxID=1381693 RepID=A0ABP0I576_9DINO
MESEKADAVEARKCHNIHEAAEWGNLGALRHFVRRDATLVHEKQSDGQTPLCFAARFNHSAAVKLLLDARAAVDAAENYSSTPLHTSAIYGSAEAAELLLSSGAPLEAADWRGNRPLHVAAREGHSTCVELLMKAGASLEATNTWGQTPLDLAREYQREEAVNILAKVQLLECQKRGMSPLPMVRLCFVGRGRAGKTTTLRRLKGEETIEGKEVSTYGLQVWAGERPLDLDEGWQDCKIDLLDQCAATSLQGHYANCSQDTLSPQSAEGLQEQKPENKHRDPLRDIDMSPESEKVELEAEESDAEGSESENKFDLEADETNSKRLESEESVGPDAAGTSTQKPESEKKLDKSDAEAAAGSNEEPGPGKRRSTMYARQMDAGLVFKATKGASTATRLQCFDFPGQKEYALINLIYFHGRGIYLVFSDMSVELEEAWKDLKFWLWSVCRYATDGPQDEPRAKPAKLPPIIVVGTKYAKSKFRKEELQKRINSFIKEMPGLEGRVKSFICLDNFSKNTKSQIQSLRRVIRNLTEEVMMTPEAWKQNRWFPSKMFRSEMPKHVGLQAEQYPIAWIQAHELLSQLDGGLKLKVEHKCLVESLRKGKGGKGYLEFDLSGRHIPRGHRVTAPKGSTVRSLLGDMGYRADGEWDFDALHWTLAENEGSSLQIEVSCDFLDLEQVFNLLANMRPQPVVGNEVEKVLKLMHCLGAICWLDADGLRETVALNVRKLSIALAELMALRFWEESKLEHDERFGKRLQESTKTIPDDVLRFQTSGVVTKELLRCVWEEEFTVPQQELVLEVMLQKGLMVRRAVCDEFTVPSCLPVTYLPEPPSTADSSAVIYINLEGFVFANLLPKIVEFLLESQFLHLTAPPQSFRNFIELRSDDAFIILSLAPVTKQRLLRVQVTTEAGAEDARHKASSLAQAFSSAVGLASLPSTSPGTAHCMGDLEQMLQVKLSKQDNDVDDADRFLRKNPCLNLECGSRCQACARSEKISELLEERFLQDLSPELCQMVFVSSLQKFSRPFGSFRFANVLYPGDVDIEEYVVLKVDGGEEADCKLKALQELSLQIQALCQNIQKLTESERKGPIRCHWSGLKAGKGENRQTLVWRAEEILHGEKAGVPLYQALEQGHGSWTAKIDVFAKVNLFSNAPSHAAHFYEVTNVIRFGYSVGSSNIIQPVTKEKDFLKAVQMNIREYSSEHPKALKYVKRLWERSAFMAQRSFHVDQHFQMLQALKPIFRHWVAELAQIAAHAETLTNMLVAKDKDLQQMQDDALADVDVLCENVGVLQTKCRSTSDDPAAAEGVESLQDVMQLLEPLKPFSSADVKNVVDVLHQVQDLMSCCVEVVVSNWLGDQTRFTSPVSKALHGRWTFPSDHPPIGCRISDKSGMNLHLVSWNVLNQRYMKYILNDSQGLKGSNICSQSEEERTDDICGKVMQIIQKEELERRVGIVCLQECWPALLNRLRGRMPSRLELLRADEEVRNQEAIIVDRGTLQILDVDRHHPFKPDQGKVVTEVVLQLKNGDRKFRIITTHLPGAPYGRARREFCDFVAQRKDAYEAIPTILAGDLNFPEEAIRPLMKHKGKLQNVHFIPISYPTNLCQGSLLPKRIDCIASLSSKEQLKVEPMKADEVLPNLTELVELLASRSWDLAEPVLSPLLEEQPLEAAAEVFAGSLNGLWAEVQRNASAPHSFQYPSMCESSPPT